MASIVKVDIGAKGNPTCLHVHPEILEFMIRKICWVSRESFQPHVTEIGSAHGDLNMGMDDGGSSAGQ